MRSARGSSSLTLSDRLGTVVTHERSLDVDPCVRVDGAASRPCRPGDHSGGGSLGVSSPSYAIMPGWPPIVTATGSRSALAASSPPVPVQAKERCAMAQYGGCGPVSGARGVARLDDGDHSGLLASGRADCGPFAGPPNVLPAFPFPSSDDAPGSPSARPRGRPDPRAFGPRTAPSGDARSAFPVSPREPSGKARDVSDRSAWGDRSWQTSRRRDRGSRKETGR